MKQHKESNAGKQKQQAKLVEWKTRDGQRGYPPTSEEKKILRYQGCHRTCSLWEMSLCMYKTDSLGHLQDCFSRRRSEGPMQHDRAWTPCAPQNLRNLLWQRYGPYGFQVKDCAEVIFDQLSAASRCSPPWYCMPSFRRGLHHRWHFPASHCDRITRSDPASATSGNIRFASEDDNMPDVQHNWPARFPIFVT